MKIPTHGVRGPPWRSLLGLRSGSRDACIVPARMLFPACEVSACAAAVARLFEYPVPRMWGRGARTGCGCGARRTLGRKFSRYTLPAVAMERGEGGAVLRTRREGVGWALTSAGRGESRGEWPRAGAQHVRACGRRGRRGGPVCAQSGVGWSCPWSLVSHLLTTCGVSI